MGTDVGLVMTSAAAGRCCTPATISDSHVPISIPSSPLAVWFSADCAAESDLALLLHLGHDCWFPKGVMLTHANLVGEAGALGGGEGGS